MKQKPIHNLPIVKHFAEYFTRKARIALGLKRKNYKTVSVDYSSRGTIYVYFHGNRTVVGSMSFWADGEPI